MARSGDRTGKVHLAGKAVKWNDCDGGSCDVFINVGRRQGRQGYVIAGSRRALAFAYKGFRTHTLSRARAHISATHRRRAASSARLGANASLFKRLEGTRLSESCWRGKRQKGTRREE